MRLPHNRPIAAAFRELNDTCSFFNLNNAFICCFH